MTLSSPRFPAGPSDSRNDWRLAAREPELVVTGRRALHGGEMRRALHLLANDFESIAMPKHGRYIDEAFPERNAQVHLLRL